MAEEVKTCPLTASVADPAPCDEEHCAWWDEDSRQCAMLTIAKSVKKVTKNVR